MFLKLFGFSKIPHIIYADLSEYYIQIHIIPGLSFLPSITGKTKAHDIVYSTKTAAQYLQN